MYNKFKYFVILLTIFLLLTSCKNFSDVAKINAKSSTYSGNMINKNFVVEDDECLYFINISDENKLYKKYKNDNLVKKIYDYSIERIFLYNDKIYFSTFIRDIDIEGTEFSQRLFGIYSINKDGSECKKILEAIHLYHFIINSSKIYYVMSDEQDSITGLDINKLCSFDINSKEVSVIDNRLLVRSIAPVQTVLYCSDNKIYYDSYDGFIEFDLESESKKVLKSIDDVYQLPLVYENQVYSKSGNKIYKTSLTEKNSNETIIEMNDDSYIRTFNITDNYIFFILKNSNQEENRAVLELFRSNHDGSNMKKLYEFEYIQNTHFDSEYIYITENDLIVYLDKYFIANKKDCIKVFDFDGNVLDWNIVK